ncbi:double-stranded RNA binding motif domain-containing protein [Acaryochloris marina]|uniref:double-stranded RNA binding motif domain-containing protein n=1 Tax=Acaryochloris marina TaxID=155978 RepID=UPI0021F9500E|nr:hypothetical protein AM10699_59410 [Acaryochloris marina MBIC10699]
MRVLHLDQEKVEDQEEDSEKSVNLSGDVVENPIGALQELCQHQQISMPRYEFEVIPEGFRCSVLEMGLRGVGEGRAKKEAKMGAAEILLGRVGGKVM